MSKQDFRSLTGFFFFTVVTVCTVFSCANKGYPEGGPKDVTPPHVLEERPVSYTRNFDKKSINIYFDEYVQLKNINDKFIISPPQAKKPKVRERGKYIMVEFEDTLRPGTTYSLDFADAIVDYNEGNPLGYYRYVFSTGDVIDSLELAGNVVDAETNEPVLGAFVFLYKNQADSVPVREIPDYVARTDSSGFFRLTNIGEADYKMITIIDDNRDYKYTPEAEQIGFIDSAVRPLVMSLSRTDTLNGDSIVTRSYTAYGPNNLYLRIFPEEVTQLYMTDESRKQRELLSFIFSIPGRNDFQIEWLDSIEPASWYVKEQSVREDSIQLWITDSNVYKRDTLRFRLSYLRTDSLNRHMPYSDTVKLVYKDRKKADRPGRRKEEPEKPVMDLLKINTSLSAEQDLNRGISFEFDKPLTGKGLDSIKLLEKVDTVYQPVKYKMVRDSIKIRQYYLTTEWKPEGEYLLQLDSARITDIYGRHNDKIEKKFKVRSQEAYGRIHLSVAGVEGPVLIQLYKPDNKKAENGRKLFSVLAEKKITQDGEVTFDFLAAGKYRIRAILDTNGNGKWDTGLYLKGIQPEDIVYLPAEINVRQNFDIEQEFNLKIPYTKEEREKGDLKNKKR